jgi:hypothetical protein
MKTLTPDRRNDIENVFKNKKSIFEDWENDEQRQIDNKHIEGNLNQCYPICNRCKTLE